MNAGTAGGVYRARRPRETPLWRCMHDHFDRFIQDYDARFQPKLGFLRPVIKEVVEKFLDCGNLEQGFARVRCPDCAHEYLLAFSCRGRWFCPSCHQKKVLLFGEFVTGRVLATVPHRHHVFTMPVMLRTYFRYDRDLLKDLCAVAYECLREYLTTSLEMPDGIPGVVMTIHTFGEYLDFHPHLHAIVADGLFGEDGSFRVAPARDLRPLENLFRARLLRMLVQKGRLPPERAEMLRKWKHSGFSLWRSRRIAPDKKDHAERLAQYIIRNSFSMEKMELTAPAGKVLYKSKMSAKTHRNFELFEPTDFIAAITQHIPDKGVQMVRYYGYYSNKSRGMRAKKNRTSAVMLMDPEERRIPSKKWRELIKKVWEVDPLECPNCGGEMKIIALIDERAVIEKILRHLGLWVGYGASRAPPDKTGQGYVIEPVEDDPFPDYEAIDQSSATG